MAIDKLSFELPDMNDLPPVDFDLDEPSSLDEALPPLPDADDEFFASLFAQEFGRPLVSDELKASIVSQVEAAAAEPRHLRVVEGGATPRPRRTSRFKMQLSRAAAAAAIVLVAISGGVALRAPTAFVQVSGPESTIQLGVNIFGMTVSATALDPAGEELLLGTNVSNMGYEDSLRMLADMMGASDAGTMNVEVSSIGGLQNSSLEDSSNKVLDTLQPQRDTLPATPVKAETPAAPQAPVVDDSSTSASPLMVNTPLAPQAPVVAQAEAQVEDAVPALVGNQTVELDAPDTPAEPSTPDVPDTPFLPDGPAESIGGSNGETVELIGDNEIANDSGSPDRPSGNASTEVLPVPVAPSLSLDDGLPVAPQGELISVLG